MSLSSGLDLSRDRSNRIVRWPSFSCLSRVVKEVSCQLEQQIRSRITRVDRLGHEHDTGSSGSSVNPGGVRIALHPVQMGAHGPRHLALDPWTQTEPRHLHIEKSPHRLEDPVCYFPRTIDTNRSGASELSRSAGLFRPTTPSQAKPNPRDSLADSISFFECLNMSF